MDYVPKLLLVADLAHRVRERLDGEVREESGLTLQQALVLCRVDLSDDGPSIGQVPREMGRSASTLTGIVDGLEARGLVTRERPAGKDRRTVTLTLTANGTKSLDRYREAVRQLMDDLIEVSRQSPPDEELDRVIGLLRQLAS